METTMIKDVMVRLDGTRADDARLAAVDQIAENFDSHIVGLFLNVLPLLIPPKATVQRLPNQSALSIKHVSWVTSSRPSSGSGWRGCRSRSSCGGSTRSAIL
jgi:hypothetical protein